MSKKVGDIKTARQKKRGKKPWTLAEIKKRAAQEREAYKKLSDEEPDALASGGDMSKILEDSCDDEKDD